MTNFIPQFLEDNRMNDMLSGNLLMLIQLGSNIFYGYFISEIFFIMNYFYVGVPIISLE